MVFIGPSHKLAGWLVCNGEQAPDGVGHILTNSIKLQRISQDQMIQHDVQGN